MGKIIFSLMFITVGLIASIIEKKSTYDFKTTVTNLSKNIKTNGFTIYTEIDHKKMQKKLMHIQMIQLQ